MSHTCEHCGFPTTVPHADCQKKQAAYESMGTFLRDIDKFNQQWEDEALEGAYWRFDALHKGYAKDRKEAGLGPMDERMAFKQAVGELLLDLADDLMDDELGTSGPTT